MRTLLAIFALFSVMTLSAQRTTETKEYYLNKSKNQKTAGYILAGGGAALIISGIIVGNGDDKNNDPNELDFGPNFDVGMWLLGGETRTFFIHFPLRCDCYENYPGKEYFLPRKSLSKGDDSIFQMITRNCLR